MWADLLLDPLLDVRGTADSSLNSVATLGPLRCFGVVRSEGLAEAHCRHTVNVFVFRMISLKRRGAQHRLHTDALYLASCENHLPSCRSEGASL